MGQLGLTDSGVDGRTWVQALGSGSASNFSNNCEILVTEIYSPFLNKVSSRVLSVKEADSTDRNISDFAIQRLTSWKSPETGFVYGTHWRVFSSEGINLDITVDFENQEIHRGLWQGSCAVQGNFRNEKVTGVGYAEQLEKVPRSLFGLMQFCVSPYHLIFQNMLGRANLGLLDRLGRSHIFKLRQVSQQ